MIKKRVIIDTGPLVALLNKNDNHHDWAVAQFSMMAPPFLSCEAVISEACFLLQSFSHGPTYILELLERQLIHLSFNLEVESKSVKYLLDKYQNIPMSLADACLVRMSEQISDSIICTVDSDFKVYRKNKRDMIPVIMPGK